MQFMFIQPNIMRQMTTFNSEKNKLEKHLQWLRRRNRPLTQKKENKRIVSQEFKTDKNYKVIRVTGCQY